MKRQRESVNEIQQQMVGDCYMLYLHRTTSPHQPGPTMTAK